MHTLQLKFIKQEFKMSVLPCRSRRSAPCSGNNVFKQSSTIIIIAV